jgi:hypothetical protein
MKHGPVLAILIASASAATLVAACSSDSGGGEPSGDGSGGATANTGGTTSATGGSVSSTGGKASGGNGGGAAGGTRGGTGGSGPDAGPGICVPPLARCDAAPCCAGSVCVESNGEHRCRETCTERTDCGSLCCLEDATSGQKLCADSSSCPAIECSSKGGPCTGAGEACCTGLVCVAWTNPPRSGCEKSCHVGADCETGCCLPLPGANASFCAAADACQCAAVDRTCGGSVHCCAGLECSSFDASGAFACKPTCKLDSDCTTGCCAKITGTVASVCLGKEWCSK